MLLMLKFAMNEAGDLEAELRLRSSSALRSTSTIIGK